MVLPAEAEANCAVSLHDTVVTGAAACWETEQGVRAGHSPRRDLKGVRRGKGGGGSRGGIGKDEGEKDIEGGMEEAREVGLVGGGKGREERGGGKRPVEEGMMSRVRQEGPQGRPWHRPFAHRQTWATDARPCPASALQCQVTYNECYRP